MFLRPNHRHKDGKEHVYWSLVETVRTRGWTASAHAVLFGRTESLSTSPLAEDHRGVQRARGVSATEVVSLGSGATRERCGQVARVLVRKVRFGALVNEVVFDRYLTGSPQNEIETWH